MKTATTAERLSQLMQQRDLRQVDILRLCKPYCEKYGIKLNRNDLSQYVNGKVEPSQFKLTILAAALGVTEPWLMGYDDGNDFSVKTSSPTVFDPQTKKLTELIAQLDERDKIKLEGILEEMLRNEKYITAGNQAIS